MLDEGRHYPRMNGRQVFRWATEKNPDFKLLPVSPTVDHAGSLKG